MSTITHIQRHWVTPTGHWPCCIAGRGDRHSAKVQGLPPVPLHCCLSRLFLWFSELNLRSHDSVEDTMVYYLPAHGFGIPNRCILAKCSSLENVWHHRSVFPRRFANKLIARPQASKRTTFRADCGEVIHAPRILQRPKTKSVEIPHEPDSPRHNHQEPTSVSSVEQFNHEAWRTDNGQRNNDQLFRTFLGALTWLSSSLGCFLYINHRCRGKS